MIAWLLASLGSAWGVMALTRAPDGSMLIPELRLSVGIAVIAGVSTLVGHGVVLFINRVRWPRALLALVMTAILTVLLYSLQGAVVMLLGPLVTGKHLAFQSVLPLALASAAPAVLSFLTFVPVLGFAFARVLQVWGVACLAAMVSSVYGAGPGRSLLVAGVAWFVMQFVARVVGPALRKALLGILARFGVRPVLLTSSDVLAGTPFIAIEERRP